MTVIAEDVEQVVRAVRAIQDVQTSQADRYKFTEALEALKDGPTAQSVPTAFALLGNSDPSIAHVGLNIIDDVVKFKWHEMRMEEKLKVRNGVLQWVAAGNYSVSSVDMHLKTAASRVFVSMMEHEWPENWPELMSQFSAIVENPEHIQQCHMVFLILRRLIEDVLTLITVQNAARRKDLQNAINANIRQIMQMVLGRLVVCLNQGADPQAVLLAKSGIELLAEIFDWVSGKDLEPFVDQIINVISIYLQQDLNGIYEVAATSLHKLASRKRQKTDEMPIVVSMFRDEPMQAILSACGLAARQSNSSVLHYKFLKTLCDLLCSLGVHLSEIWNHLNSQPNNFPTYLDAVQQFFTHPSLYIRSETAQVILAFSVNDSIRRTATVIERMPQILMSLPKSMEKVGNLTDDLSPTNFYSRIDYETEQDFMQDFTRLRDRCFRLIKENMEQHFTVLSSLVTDWVNGRCLLQTESIPDSEWDSMKRYITNYLQVVYQMDLVKPEVDQWLLVLFSNVHERLNSLCNPRVSSDLLSILSAFFVVMKNHADRIPGVIDLLQRFLKIPDPVCRNTNDSLDVVNLKRHSINVLLKLVNASGDIVRPYARLVLDVVIDVAPSVSTLQKANLVQVLAALSNLASTPDEQQLFLESALRDNINFFQGPEFGLCLKSVRDFFNFIGALSPIPVTENDPNAVAFVENRLKLKANLFAIEGAVSQVSIFENGSNPLFQLLIPVIRNIFQFVACLNSIYSAEGMSLLQETYGDQILKMSATERQSIIYSQSSSDGIDELVNQEIELGAVNRMRRFLSDIVELVQSVVGLIGQKMSRDFYSLSDSAVLVEAVFRNADCIPDYKLRFWLKRAWSRIVCHCPAERVTVVLPILSALTQHMYSLLSDRWNVVAQLDEDGDVTEEELLTQQMVAILSREYAEMLKLFVFGAGLMVKEDSKKHPSELMNPLCLEALKNPSVLEPTVLSILSLLTCPDSKTVTKLLPIARCVLGTFHSSFDTVTARTVLIQIIRSLQINGSDEALCGPLLGLSFSVYAWLRPSHPTLWEILSEVPESTAEKIQEFDSKVMAFNTSNENIMEKNKRELMRKLLKPVIALKVGEQFRRTVPLRTLRRTTQNAVM